MIKAIYLDFDGTVYSHTLNKVPDSAAKALQSAQKKGIRIILATGRSLKELKLFDSNGVHFDAYLLNNGQEILDKDYRVIHVEYIEGTLKEKLIGYFKEKRLVVQLCNTEKLFVNFTNEQYILAQRAINSAPASVKEYEGEDFDLCSIFFDNEKDCAEVMAMREFADITYWHTGATDIIPKGGSKAKAIAVMNSYLKISADETMAIGDGQNDISMIEYCGIGVAMGNSADEVKNKADYVTGDIDRDGIKTALEHFKLICEGDKI